MEKYSSNNFMHFKLTIIPSFEVENANCTTIMQLRILNKSQRLKRGKEQ